MFISSRFEIRDDLHECVFPIPQRCVVSYFQDNVENCRLDEWLILHFYHYQPVYSKSCSAMQPQVIFAVRLVT